MTTLVAIILVGIMNYYILLCRKLGGRRTLLTRWFIEAGSKWNSGISTTKYRVLPQNSNAINISQHLKIYIGMTVYLETGMPKQQNSKFWITKDIIHLISTKSSEFLTRFPPPPLPPLYAHSLFQSIPPQKLCRKDNATTKKKSARKGQKRSRLILL